MKPLEYNGKPVIMVPAKPEPRKKIIIPNFKTQIVPKAPKCTKPAIDIATLIKNHDMNLTPKQLEFIKNAGKKGLKQTAITGMFQHPMNEPRKQQVKQPSMPKMPTIPQSNKLPQLDPMVIYKTPVKPKQLKYAIASGNGGFPPTDPEKIFKKKLPTRILEKIKTLYKDNKFNSLDFSKFLKRIR